jgi:predicted nucleotidyltransferase
MAAFISQNELKSLIHRYSDVLKQSIRVDAIYLFGSYLTEKADIDSDIDLFVVSPDFTDDITYNHLTLMRARRDIDLRIEPHPVKSDEIDSNVLFEICKTTMKKVI